MGRNNKKYRKTLHQQIYDRLTGMQAFGQSKKQAMAEGTEKDKIFAFSTYQTYWKHSKYFAKWIEDVHPECTTLKAARHHVNEWLQMRSKQTDKQGKRLSAWTIQTEAAAMNKLFGIDKADPDRFQPPKRRREDIMRSRIATKRDHHFSVANNAELIAFCRGTGCRRNVLEKLEGRDLWSRESMEKQVNRLTAKRFPTESETRQLYTLQEALSVFPEQDFFIHHRKDKNGKYRFAPVIGPDKEKIIQRMRQTGPTEKVWRHVHSGADVHGYRAEYATTVYKFYARSIEDIPYDRINKGSGRRYQSGVYTCRKDEYGKKLDRVAMKKCSIALGHNRVSVVANNYLRGV